jgi:hypothetical protein
VIDEKLISEISRVKISGFSPDAGEIGSKKSGPSPAAIDSKNGRD